MKSIKKNIAKVGERVEGLGFGIANGIAHVR